MTGPVTDDRLGADNETRTRFAGLEDRGTAYIPCPHSSDFTNRERSSSITIKGLRPQVFLDGQLVANEGVEPSS